MEHPRTAGRAVALARAAHGGPALAVTVVAGLLAVTADLSATRTALVVAAVLTGQLSIGWSNDLVDVDRDRAVHRTDKPLVTGDLPVAAVRTACALPLVATVPLSLACGLGRASFSWSAWRRLGLQPRDEGDRVVVGALRRRVRRAPGLRLARRLRTAPPLWVPVAGALLGWARTSSTPCRTSTTTWRPGSAGCPTGSARDGRRRSPRPSSSSRRC